MRTPMPREAEVFVHFEPQPVAERMDVSLFDGVLGGDGLVTTLGKVVAHQRLVGFGRRTSLKLLDDGVE